MPVVMVFPVAKTEDRLICINYNHQHTGGDPWSTGQIA